MIISAETAKKLVATAEERQANFGSGQKRFERGVHILMLSDVKGEELKKGENAGMDQLTLVWGDPEGHHADIKQTLTYGEDKPWAQINLGKIVEILKRGFGVNIQPAKNVEEVANQFRKQKGQKVKAAIYGKQNLWKKLDRNTKEPILRKDGHPDWTITEFPEVRYVGPVTEDLYFDEAKAIVALGAKDLMDWENYKEKYGETVGAPTTKAESPAADLDDVNFDNEAPVAKTTPVQAAATKVAPAAAAAPAAPKDALDDLDLE